MIKIISTANAGLLIDFGKHKLLIDAFHTQQYDIYETVTGELYRKITEDADFADPDLLIYTHCHPDHFSAEMTEDAARLWPGMKIILPEAETKGIILTKEEETHTFGELSVTFRRLPHEDVKYAMVPHYGLLIECGPVTILDPGDCAICSDELAAFINGRHIDIAILNFPWVTLRRARKFVKEIICPDHTVICHLPNPARDPFGYEQNTENVIARDFPGSDVRIIRGPLQKEIILF